MSVNLWSFAAAVLLTGGATYRVLADDGPKPAEPPVDEPPAAADAEAPLPLGWPAATMPGAVEVKSYPAYRAAVSGDKDSTMQDQGRLFWPLFLHIQREGIAMTTPVVMTYDAKVLERPGARGAASMEFLYRRPDQGQAGPARGTVAVEDRPAGTFLCLGLQGDLDEARMADSLAKLRAWLAEHPGEWVESGPPRRLGYHGPGTPLRRRLGEVQIPVKPAKSATGNNPAATTPE